MASSDYRVNWAMHLREECRDHHYPTWVSGVFRKTQKDIYDIICSQTDSDNYVRCALTGEDLWWGHPMLHPVLILLRSKCVLAAACTVEILGADTCARSVYAVGDVLSRIVGYCQERHNSTCCNKRQRLDSPQRKKAYSSDDGNEGGSSSKRPKRGHREERADNMDRETDSEND